VRTKISPCAHEDGAVRTKVSVGAHEDGAGKHGCAHEDHEDGGAHARGLRAHTIGMGRLGNLGCSRPLSSFKPRSPPRGNADAAICDELTKQV
jgi:hypothetical protein